MKLRDKQVENFRPAVVIAEIGANHNGDMELARKMVTAAKEAGADYAKFQSWTKESIFARVVYDENYFLGDDYRDRDDYTLEQIVDEFSLSHAQLAEMKEYCDEVGIGFSSTPFSKSEADFLVDELDADFIKVASMDCNNYPFLEHLGRKKRPVILSTGLSALWEIAKAVDVLEAAGAPSVAILHCISIYPPPDDIVNLRNIDMLRETFERPVGFSDHSLGTLVPIAALARGACIIEKHFTLDKEMFGWDHKVSASVQELADITEAARRVPTLCGTRRRVVSSLDLEKRPAFRRSVVAARPIEAGKVIEHDDLDVKRPARGVPPGELHTIVGRVAKRDIPFDKLLDDEDY